MKVLVFCSTSKPLISSYLGINAVYRNSFDSLPSELIVIAHDNDRLSGDRGNLWGGGKWYMTYVVYNGKDGTDG
uniref:hypothetical protein n=1 Tax=Sutterella wadsworthensis TaxID=40545 RepID=UPI00267053CD